MNEIILHLVDGDSFIYVMKFEEITSETPTKGYIAWELSGSSRSALAREFHPQFSEFIGHHITYKFPAYSNEELPDAGSMRVIGYAINDDGLEALVVEIDGSTERPDGRTYHITWSLDRSAGFKPVHSNDLIQNGWSRVDNPINISATARFFRG